MSKQLLVLGFFATARSQFSVDNPRPDITFGDHNDRFDISPMMQADRLFRESDREDYRRFDSDRLRDKLLARRELEEFNYHDTMVDDGTSAQEFEENLKILASPKTNLRAGPEIPESEEMPDYPKIYRRIGNDGKERVLMDYAVPIDFKIQGYLMP